MSAFNVLLNKAGIALTDVRLLRHMDHRSTKGRTIYELWRDARPSFNLYQSHQKFGDRTILNAPYWAAFVGTPDKETMFVGLYKVMYLGPLDKDTPWPHANGMDKAGSCDKYRLTLDQRLREFIGELYVNWGDGYRAWIQHAVRRDKPIIRGAAERELAADLEAIIRQPRTSATTKEALVDARLGQGAFRESVLQLWNGRCAVCGASTLVAIRASHIKPWRSSTNAERLDPHNGLPLVASLDALFDAGLISFDAAGRMLVSPTLKLTERGIFGLGKPLAKKPSKGTATYLAHHRAEIFKA
jgi:hypothetical protein